MGWQELAVAIVGVVVAAYLLWRVRCILRGGAGACSNCSKECPLRRRGDR
ncbi:MAG: hypothetical protein UHY58_03750 [Alistipes sp.]|nr:hypothetical protein [Alistipes sp.]